MKITIELDSAIDGYSHVTRVLAAASGSPRELTSEEKAQMLHGEPVTEGKPPVEAKTRTRKPKEEPSATPAEEPSPSEDTPASGASTTGDEPQVMVDAGTGQVVEIEGDVDYAALREEVKTLGLAKLAVHGKPVIQPILMRYEPEGKLSKVPDDKLAELKAEFEALPDQPAE